MDSLGTHSRCARCVELQRSFLKTLEEKRTLLLRVQSEQERSRKLQRDLDCLRTRQSENYGRTGEEKALEVITFEIRIICAHTLS